MRGERGRLEPQNEGHIGSDEHQLGHQHAGMPAVGTHLMEVDLAEGDQQRHKHRQREENIEHRLQLRANTVELRHEIKGEIGKGADGDGAGQCPVLQKANESHYFDNFRAKVQKKLHLSSFFRNFVLAARSYCVSAIKINEISFVLLSTFRNFAKIRRISLYKGSLGD